MRPAPEEDAPLERPAGPIIPAHGDGLGPRLARLAKALVLGIFGMIGLVAVIDMALTVADPARPMQVAHLVFGDLVRWAGPIFGAF